MTKIIPTAGIISLEDLAEVMNTDGATLDKKFKEFEIPIMRLGNRHRTKFVSLERINQYLVKYHV